MDIYFYKLKAKCYYQDLIKILLFHLYHLCCPVEIITGLFVKQIFSNNKKLDVSPEPTLYLLTFNFSKRSRCHTS